MRDLYRCLDEYPLPFLRAIADVFAVRLADDDARETVTRLAEAMLAPEALGRALAALSPEAKAALAEVARQGGAVPSHRLALTHGPIRRLGPARLEREQPWLNPENALEELYFRGLVYRAYGSLGEYFGEVFLIPQQLLERLPSPNSYAVPTQPTVAESPQEIQSDGSACVEDILGILVRLRRNRVRLADEEAGGPPSEVIRQSDLQARLLGEWEPERLAFLWRLLWRLGLVERKDDLVRPSLRAREWLRLTDAERQRRAFAAWRDDSVWDELEWVPSLQCEETPGRSVSIAVRKQLLDALKGWPTDGWYTLESFVVELKQHHPDYLRPHGDLTNWYVRDRSTGEYLSGLGSWDKIEGALARHVLSRPLRWLGAVELGFDPAMQGPAVFRVTESGQHLLAARRAEGEPKPQRRAPLATVAEDLTVRISLLNSMHERYQLERFAEWRSQDIGPYSPPEEWVATYCITDESVWQGQNSGIKIEQILRFLERISGGAVPAHVQRQLLAWGGRLGRASIRRTVLLQTTDADTMQQIAARPELAALLGESLTPTTCLVEESNVEALIEHLKAMGIWPRLVH